MKQFNLMKYNLLTAAILLFSLNVFAQNGAWKKVSSLPTTRAAMMNVCVVDGKIYFIGGTSGGSDYPDSDINEAYDPSTNTWEIKKNMPTARGFLAAVVVNDTIYAIGGGCPPNNISAVEAYDPHTDKWTKKADMLIPKTEIQAASVNGKIYVMRGAFDSKNGLIYDPVLNQWKELIVPSELPRVSSMAVYNNLIYVFGGGASPDGPAYKWVYVYDPNSDSWTKKKDMPTPRFSFQTLLYNGKIYAMGGTQGRGTALSDLEVYDPVNDTWEIEPDMPFRGAYLSGAVVNNKIYITQGTADWITGYGHIWEYDPSFHTDVTGGNVSGTWTLAKSPYYINGEITIPNDSTLTIKPGVEVVFMGHYKFNVQGRLLAVGTKTDSIKFFAADTVNGWHGIRFSQTPGTNDTSKFAYCSFKYGKANTGDYSSLDRCGGAIFVHKFNKVLITNCLFKSNMNNGDVSNTGGAAIFQSEASPVIINSTFLNNTGTTDGAIACVYPSSSIISNNTILHNSGVWGTILSYGSDNKPIISYNIISDNIVTGGAAGIIIMEGASPTIENNVITHNRAINKNLTYAGGISCYNNVKPLITNNIIALNSADLGGGIAFLEHGNATLINNTIVSNMASAGGGIYCGIYGGGGNSDPVMVDNILYGNFANNGSQVFIEDAFSDPVFQYNDIQGGKEGFTGAGAGVNYNGLYENNIDADPLLVHVILGASDNDYSLSNSSPCIGKGINSTKIAGIVYDAPPFCIMGVPRPSPAGSNPDLGACENLLGAQPVRVEQEQIALTDFVLNQNYPNPFNPTTVISYQLPVTSHVTLKIYDILGNEIETLVNEEKPSGNYEVKFDGSKYASGIYFYQLRTYNFLSTKKMLIIK